MRGQERKEMWHLSRKGWKERPALRNKESRKYQYSGRKTRGGRSYL